MDAIAYLAAPGYESQLAHELGRLGGDLEEIDARLFLRHGPPCHAAWAVDTWFDVRRLPVPSIGAAARQLRELGAWWEAYPLTHYRRSQLICDKLPRRRAQPLTVPPAHRLRPLGAFALTDRDTMLVAPCTARPFEGGCPPLVENRHAPPSRAYKKLCEALLLLGDQPRPGQTVLDLGAAPGAWTWTLARLGCTVHAYDKASLDDAVAALPGVHQHRESAFALDPAAIDADWLCSDVICYPGRLLTLIERWWDHPRCRRAVITVKFQGAVDDGVIDAFKTLPESVLVHLWHNKHELTWIRHPALRPPPTPWPWTA